MKKLLLIVFACLSINAFSQSYRMRSEGSIEQPELENISGNNIDLSNFSNPVSTAGSPTFDEGVEGTQSSGSGVVADGARQSDEKAEKGLQEIVTSIYPNPANDYIVVKLDQNIETTISILNLVGQVMQTTTVEALTNYLDVSGLQGGIYFVSIQYGDQKVVRKIRIVD